MISAKQAKEQSIENKATNAEKDLEESIKKAIKKGKTECTFLCSYDLLESMTAKAEEAGYRVTPVQGGIKIYWG